MLRVNKITSYYGKTQALFDVSLHCKTGQVTTLLGRNGMGKTTTVNTIMGIQANGQGEMVFNKQSIVGTKSHVIAQRGIGLVPEGRQIFPNLNVKENLIATAKVNKQHPDPWDLPRVLDFLPRLKDRLQHMGNQLSGGEQQMLAIARALMLNPRLLILDEATEGLAPLIRQEIWQRLADLKQSGMTILLIDKNINELLRIADQHFILEKGVTVWSGSTEQLRADPDLTARYLGI